MSLSIKKARYQGSFNHKEYKAIYNRARDRKIKPIEVEDFLSTRFGLLAPTSALG
ncbi:hypothetical protein LguiB_013236 [Lonicera macranthoides]